MNRLFPCFDQPNLKAKMNLISVAHIEWKIMSNERENYILPYTQKNIEKVIGSVIKTFKANLLNIDH
jgi:hypothetical protein